jgi:hypothetical protein
MYNFVNLGFRVEWSDPLTDKYFQKNKWEEKTIGAGTETSNLVKNGQIT